METSLKKMLIDEEEYLLNLLQLMDKQYSFVLKRDVVELENIVTEIQEINKKVAIIEIERKKLLGSNTIKEFVQRSSDEELDSVYRRIKKTISLIQKQSGKNMSVTQNELLFINKIISYVSPYKECSFYDSKGQLNR